MKESSAMEFTYQEIARLNQMIGIALMSGKVEFDEVSESVHKKVAQEIYRRIQKDCTNKGTGEVVRDEKSRLHMQR